MQLGDIMKVMIYEKGMKNVMKMTGRTSTGGMCNMFVRDDISFTNFCLFTRASGYVPEVRQIHGYDVYEITDFRNIMATVLENSEITVYALTKAMNYGAQTIYTQMKRNNVRMTVFVQIMNILGYYVCVRRKRLDDSIITTSLQTLDNDNVMIITDFNCYGLNGDRIKWAPVKDRKDNIQEDKKSLEPKD